MEDFAFSLVEAELPFFWPFSQEVKVWIWWWSSRDSILWKILVSSANICASDHAWEVIYENEEQYRPQDTPLGDAT